MTDRADTQEDVVLKACGIRKVFRSGADELEVLKGVSLEVRRGEMIAITGASGVGKTSFLYARVPPGLRYPERGVLRRVIFPWVALGKSKEKIKFPSLKPTRAWV